MPRLLSILALLLLTTAPMLAQSAVWKVTRDGRTLFVGGTLHLLRPADFPLPSEFDRAFAESAVVYFETDITRAKSPEMQQVIEKHAAFTDGRTIDKVLKPATWEAVQSYCSKNGLSADQLKQFKPWFFVIMIGVLELQKIGVAGAGVDDHFHAKAKEAGKKMGGLETFEQQVAFITQMGAGHEDEFVANTLEDLDDISRIFKDVVAAWRAGKMEKLDQLLLADMRKKFPTVYKELLVQRNDDWVPKLLDMLKSPETEYVLVGAGHLAGPDSLLKKLRAAGCAIEQVKASVAEQKY